MSVGVTLMSAGAAEEIEVVVAANSLPNREYLPVNGVNSSCAPSMLLIFCIDARASACVGSRERCAARRRERSRPGSTEPRRDVGDREAAETEIDSQSVMWNAEPRVDEERVVEVLVDRRAEAGADLEAGGAQLEALADRRRVGQRALALRLGGERHRGHREGDEQRAPRGSAGFGVFVMGMSFERRVTFRLRSAFMFMAAALPRSLVLELRRQVDARRRRRT